MYNSSTGDGSSLTNIQYVQEHCSSVEAARELSVQGVVAVMSSSALKRDVACRAYIVVRTANAGNPSNGRGRAAGDESREGWGNR